MGSHHLVVGFAAAHFPALGVIPAFVAFGVLAAFGAFGGMSLAKSILFILL
jgi:hypothetical protein